MNEDYLITELLFEVRDELHKATKKFGPFVSAHEGYAVIKEELDELWDAIKANKDRMCQFGEARQVAAMAIRYMLDVCMEKETK